MQSQIFLFEPGEDGCVDAGADGERRQDKVVKTIRDGDLGYVRAQLAADLGHSIDIEHGI